MTIRYEVAQLASDSFSVFVIHTESPLIWRQVAVFASRDRADSYATMENEFANWPESNLRADELPVTDAPPEPVSGLAGPANRQIVRASEIAVAEPENTPENVPENVPVEPQNPAQLKIDHLDPLTEMQASVFRAIVAGAKTYKQIGMDTAVSNPTDHTLALMRKGYIGTDAKGGYIPLVTGEPRITTAAYKNSWTEAQLAGLRALCETGGDFKAFAASVGRTENACRTMAHVRGLYKTWKQARYAEKSEDTVKLLEPEPEVVPPPHANGFDGKIVLGDLNHAQRLSY